jgi:uracil phosphoribosyltransferase
MTKDIIYEKLFYPPQQISHHYGPQVTLLSDPYYLSILSKLCSPDLKQPHLSFLTKKIYRHLFTTAVNLFVSRHSCEIKTRMESAHPQEGYYRGECIDSSASFVFVDLARAGILPAQVCYEEAHDYFSAEQLRQDHFYVGRRVNEQNKVVGVDLKGHKIGGDIHQRYVFFPDPMGATGSSMSHVLNFYKNLSSESQIQTARLYLAIHLIVTPEYLKKMQQEHPDLHILALRLDRGLSNSEILSSIPGEYWNHEKGLNDHDYIVPGAGGMGELLNNAFV